MSRSADQPLRVLPAVSELLTRPDVQAWLVQHGTERVKGWLRRSLDQQRERILADASGDSGGQPQYDAVEDAVSRTGKGTELAWNRSQEIQTESIRRDLSEQIIATVRELIIAQQSVRLAQVVNATGVVLHTSLGRSPLAKAAIAAIADCSRGCNLEVDLHTGDRRSRGYQIQQLFCDLTGAEAALVVNNNAAATVLALSGLASGKEVVISRGQLIEIGGSFRLPDVFAASGAILKEIGTTNRTHITDYERAVGPNTAALLRVHPSNYHVAGFASTPNIESLVGVGRRLGVHAIDDIGSGSLLDPQLFGLPSEPTFSHSLGAGADLVLGSGDKLLGGPQCGIILGKKELIRKLQEHPLARAFRVDKLTLAALQATLEIYQRGAATSEIPVWQMLSAQVDVLADRASRIARAITSNSLKIEILSESALVGGGSLPGSSLPTVCLQITHSSKSPSEIALTLRQGIPHLFPRIDRDAVLVDLRSVLPDEDSLVEQAISGLLGS